jgi:large subunit ribosomal protein L6
MSRVGSNAITIPSEVTMSQDGGRIVVKGKKGELSTPIHSDVAVAIADGVATLKPARNSRQAKALWGTMRANISNMVVGVSEGFTKKVPAGLTVTVENNTNVLISGADKIMLGQFASEVRSKRPPEPFKGKGVKYADEHIVRKEGKKK